MPLNITKQYDSGTSHMGSLTVGIESDENNKARFGMDTSKWGLKFIRGHFRDLTGSASGTAACYLHLDSARGPAHDTRIFTLSPAVGLGQDINFRIAMDELEDWYFEPGDKLVLVWTNPDDGNIGWGVEVGIYAVSGVGL